MPSLGADMEAGTLVEWMVGPGDRVKHGDIVAVVETQKGAIEIEIFTTGIVDRLEAELGQTLKVGAPLALIRSDGEAAGTTPSTKPAGPAPGPPERRPPPAVPRAATTGPAASPAARARAAELRIDLASLKGTGPGGAIVLADVVQSSAAPGPARAVSQSPDRAGILAEMRKAIAAAMARSKREIPHYYLSHTVDLGAAADWLADHNAARPPEDRLLPGALLAKATARAATAVPEMNGRFDADGFHPSSQVHLGVAVALRGGGLVAPAILDADRRDLADLMNAMRDLTSRARAGRLRSSEMSMATLTLSSLGESGVEMMTGIIVPPQVALVTAGSPQPMPLVRDGTVIVRPSVILTLAADHRVSDGRLGARFLLEIDHLLQTPEAL